MIAGTRKSKLAIIQTEMVLEEIKRVCPQEEVLLHGMDTNGDKNLAKALSDFGGKGAFTQEIEAAMLSGQIDLAVHSAKDVPLEMPDGLEITAVIARGDSRDVWVSKIPERIEELPAGSVAGTGSKRRYLQLLEMNRGLHIRNIRGNVETRLRKLSEEDYTGIILAAAGLKRLHYLEDACENEGEFTAEGRKYYYRMLDPQIFLPAAGQGIIAVEAPSGHNRDIYDAITDTNSDIALIAERSFLRTIGGSCNAAAAVYTAFTGKTMTITAKYAPDDLHMLKSSLDMTLSEDYRINRQTAEHVGKSVARKLLGMEVSDGR